MTASWECPACGVRVDGSDRLFDIRVAFHQGHVAWDARPTP